MSTLSWRRKVLVAVATLAAVAGVTFLPSLHSTAYADVLPFKSSLPGIDGKTYWVQNHLVSSAAHRKRGGRHEYLVVWAGDENAGDLASNDIKDLAGTLTNLRKVVSTLPGPDFLAVIDVTKGSSDYGKVVNTGTVGPIVENEPHHMQYIWHKGEKIYAGGLYTATTYVFDVTKLPALSLSGVTLPQQTLGGSVPDAYWVLKDGTAYGTYMGGPVSPGPYRYSHGEVRSGDGFGGTPGEIVRLDEHARPLVEAPAASASAEDSKLCIDTPQTLAPSCANPHGIQVREDLNTIVASDFAEPRNIILDPVRAPSPYLRRPTVRTFDISDRNYPKLKSVSYLPLGPRGSATDPLHEENRGVMETTVTNLPKHKGAFAESMQGGAIYYTPDITARKPVWREVFDNSAADNRLNGGGHNTGVGDNSGWLQTSQDDKTLYHAVIGRAKGALGPDDPGTSGGVFTLDISKLVDAGTDFKCNIDQKSEIQDGGHEADCPKVQSTLPINEGTAAGGPHWGALDNWKLDKDGYYEETTQPNRLATSNYFVARNNLTGDHKVCLEDIDKDGKITLDKSFRDEFTGETCVSFNRLNWPHGPFGDAKPHSELFVVADEDIK
jgi:hypothetical protein